MNTEDIIFLGSRDVRRLLSVEDCISAVEGAFRLYGEGKAPAPGVLGIHLNGGGFHIKAGSLDLRKRYFAAKVNGNFPGNPSRLGLPTIQGVIVLCDAETGTPLAIMDSRDVTTLRTAAATAVAARYLARLDSRTITICGCGEQAHLQLKALAHIFSLQRVFAFDIRPEAAALFSEELRSQLHVEVTPVNEPRSAVVQSDICVTCTPSRRPILTSEDVAEGTFVAAVGADNPHKNEIEPALMSKAKVVCDVLEQCAVMGDLHHALDSGVMRRSDVFAELGSIVAGTKPGRESEREITIFDSTGMALQDVAAAAFAYEKAVELNAGARLCLAA